MDLHKENATMSVIFKKTITFFERVGRARAAGHLASMGYHDEAKRLMTDA